MWRLSSKEMSHNPPAPNSQPTAKLVAAERGAKQRGQTFLHHPSQSDPQLKEESGFDFYQLEQVY